MNSCSAYLEIADAHELAALSHCDEGDKDSAKIEMDSAHAIRALVKALNDANDLCRSAMQIAQRIGKETDWSAFTQQLSESLSRQHLVMYSQSK